MTTKKPSDWIIKREDEIFNQWRRNNSEWSSHWQSSFQAIIDYLDSQSPSPPPDSVQDLQI